ncbi:DUF1203 domain-containing protein [Jiangella asiatica]|uniref:DUF1203 domain-containing protein n=1 Tax=Jiangella asiatica TaxID=2530372 RepID=A0A4R5CES4_9ACTN|nr:DUF1203 domain-containing protein [Jiangella asiatica]TDD98075.1 DUF1203 domain-containing protein [Jiangella asiatica]
MTTYRYHAIPADVATALRVRDDAGETRTPFVDDDGGAPLRCCLRRSTPGESIVLVSYAPLRRWAAEHGAEPGAYDEVGPVFLHADECSGPDGDGFPAAVASSRRVFRGYDKRGHIVGGLLVDPAPSAARIVAEAALDDLFADPAVELVHVRAVEFGCFHTEVRRPS